MPFTTLLLRKLSLLVISVAITIAKPTSAASELLNAVVAMVYETPITVDDIKIQTAPLEEELFRQFGHDPVALQQKVNEVRQNALETLIDRQLIINEFESEGYSLPESVIDEQVKDRVRRQFGDHLTLTKTLQARGITYETFRKSIRQQVIVDALTARNVNSVVLVSPFEIERYYQENIDKYQQEERIRLRMIFLRHQPGDDQASERLLQEIRSKIQSGASFADMASVYHNGSQRSNGGDWGWVERSVLREDLAEIAFSLKPKTVSEVIRKDEGCYLMHIDGHRAAEPQPLAEVRQDIEKTLRAEERNRLQKQWISTLRKKAFVRYY
ncbi:MAG: Chaperone SurA [Verrucomicrobia subdivision 3 bacterium]|nr:Chaperone SurA [Limisphaerales bacterium]MCS1412575.1 Chaperone SurA [Limisphaerales bacterium]